MDRTALVAAIGALINDNSNSEISPNDVRLALMEVFDTALLNGSTPTSPEIKHLYELNPDTHALTDALYNKLVTLQGDHFKGTYNSLPELQTAHPKGNDGDYAYVHTAKTEETYIWSATPGSWILSATSSTSVSLTPSQIKTMYESNSDTNGFTDTLKKKLTALSDHDRFKGVFTTEALLLSTVPTANDGDYAYVDDGANDIVMYVYDKSRVGAGTTHWVELVDSKGIALDAKSLKTLYESNADTNAYTDAEKSALDALVKGGGYDAKQALGLALLKDGNLGSDYEIEYTIPQVLPTTATDMLKNNKAITVRNAFILVRALKDQAFMHHGEISSFDEVQDLGIYYYTYTGPGSEIGNPGNINAAQDMVIIAIPQSGDGVHLEVMTDTEHLFGIKTTKTATPTWESRVKASQIGDLHSVIGSESIADHLKKIDHTLNIMNTGTHSSAATYPTDFDVTLEGTVKPKITADMNPKLVDGTYTVHFKASPLAQLDGATLAFHKVGDTYGQPIIMAGQGVVKPVTFKQWIHDGTAVEITVKDTHMTINKVVASGGTSTAPSTTTGKIPVYTGVKDFTKMTKLGWYFIPKGTTLVGVDVPNTDAPQMQPTVLDAYYLSIRGSTDTEIRLLMYGSESGAPGGSTPWIGVFNPGDKWFTWHKPLPFAPPADGEYVLKKANQGLSWVDAPSGGGGSLPTYAFTANEPFSIPFTHESRPEASYGKGSLLGSANIIPLLFWPHDNITKVPSKNEMHIELVKTTWFKEDTPCVFRLQAGTSGNEKDWYVMYDKSVFSFPIDRDS